jgi:predicted nucleotidyltransferase
MNADEILKTIRDNKDKLTHLGVDRIGLFGSHVRGEAHADSDLDFLVDFVKGKKNYDNFIDLCFLLEETFNSKIDLLTSESLSPYLKEQIEAEVRFEVLH